jgi:hypothetical protein
MPQHIRRLANRGDCSTECVVNIGRESLVGFFPIPTDCSRTTPPNARPISVTEVHSSTMYAPLASRKAGLYFVTRYSMKEDSTSSTHSLRVSNRCGEGRLGNELPICNFWMVGQPSWDYGSIVGNTDISTHQTSVLPVTRPKPTS